MVSLDLRELALVFGFVVRERHGLLANFTGEIRERTLNSEHRGALFSSPGVNLRLNAVTHRR